MKNKDVKMAGLWNIGEQGNKCLYKNPHDVIPCRSKTHNSVLGDMQKA